MLVVFAVASLIESARDVTFALLLRIDVLVIIATVILLMVSARRFRRDRIFE